MLKVTITAATLCAVSIANMGFAQEAKQKTDEEAAKEFNDFTLPQFQGGKVTPETYVDMGYGEREFCPDHPYRPGWVMVQPKGEGWKSRYGQALYRIKFTELVEAAGECTCDTRFPDWEIIREEFHEQTDDITDLETGKKLSHDLKRSAWQRSKNVRQMCREARRKVE